MISIFANFWSFFIPIKPSISIYFNCLQFFTIFGNSNTISNTPMFETIDIRTTWISV